MRNHVSRILLNKKLREFYCTNFTGVGPSFLRFLIESVLVDPLDMMQTRVQSSALASATAVAVVAGVARGADGIGQTRKNMGGGNHTASLPTI